MTAVSKDMWMREAAKKFRQDHPTGTMPMPDIDPDDPLGDLALGIDKDGDGRINLAEYNELMSRAFDRFDQNPQDGTLSMSELDRVKGLLKESPSVTTHPKEPTGPDSAVQLQNQASSWWSKNWWVVVVVVVVVLLLLGFLGLAFYWRRRREHK